MQHRIQRPGMQQDREHNGDLEDLAPLPLQGRKRRERMRGMGRMRGSTGISLCNLQSVHGRETPLRCQAPGQSVEAFYLSCKQVALLVPAQENLEHRLAGGVEELQ